MSGVSFKDLLKGKRVVAHVDMDAFYSQVEQMQWPSLRGKPVGVLQYNPSGPEENLDETNPRRFKNDSNGSLIAVSYEARPYGVKRNMRGDVARKLCPEIQFVQVPTAHGKSDMGMYRRAGSRVIQILTGGGATERASVDEAYVDLTQQALKRLEEWMESHGGDPEARLPMPVQPSRVFVALPEALASQQPPAAAPTDPSTHAAAHTAPHSPWALDDEDEDEEVGGEEEDEAHRHVFGFEEDDPAALLEDVSRDPPPPRALLPPPSTALLAVPGPSKGPAPLTSASGPTPQDVNVPSASAAQWFGRPLREVAPADLLLAFGALVVAELRTQVSDRLGFTCSAGVASNKLLAKLCSGLNKPNRQTVLPEYSVGALLAPLPIDRLRMLGGKYGETIKSTLGIQTVGELAQFPQPRLVQLFGMEKGAWIWEMARGVHRDEVKNRTLAKSQGCGKTFRGALRLHDLEKAEYWVEQLCRELHDRLQEDYELNARVPTMVNLQIWQQTGPALTVPPTGDVKINAAMWQGSHCSSRSGPLQGNAITVDALFRSARQQLRRWATDNPGWEGVGISAINLATTDFITQPKNIPSITKFFSRAPPASVGAGGAGVPGGRAGPPAGAPRAASRETTPMGTGRPPGSAPAEPMDPEAPGRSSSQPALGPGPGSQGGPPLSLQPWAAAPTAAADAPGPETVPSNRPAQSEPPEPRRAPEGESVAISAPSKASLFAFLAQGSLVEPPRRAAAATAHVPPPPVPSPAAVSVVAAATEEEDVIPIVDNTEDDELEGATRQRTHDRQETYTAAGAAAPSLRRGRDIGGGGGGGGGGGSGAAVDDGVQIRMSDIDPRVLDALPLELRKEVLLRADRSGGPSVVGSKRKEGSGAGGGGPGTSRGGNSKRAKAQGGTGAGQKSLVSFFKG